MAVEDKEEDDDDDVVDVVFDNVVGDVAGSAFDLIVYSKFLDILFCRSLTYPEFKFRTASAPPTLPPMVAPMMMTISAKRIQKFRFRSPKMVQESRTEGGECISL